MPFVPFEKGNKCAAKLVTEEDKIEAYNDYCEYVASGLPRKAWRWRKPNKTITWQTLETYIKKEPEVFNPIYKEMAICDSLDFHAKTLRDAAIGKNTKANIAANQIFLRNIHGWDTRDQILERDETASADAQAKLLTQLQNLQNNASRSCDEGCSE